MRISDWSSTCALPIWVAEGITMIERRDTMEFFRDAAADQFRLHLRKPWLPRSGPLVNRKALTSAVLARRQHIDGRSAERRVGTECVSTCRYREPPSSYITNNSNISYIYSKENN